MNLASLNLMSEINYTIKDTYISLEMIKDETNENNEISSELNVVRENLLTLKSKIIDLERIIDNNSSNQDDWLSSYKGEKIAFSSFFIVSTAIRKEAREKGVDTRHLKVFLQLAKSAYCKLYLTSMELNSLDDDLRMLAI